MAAPLAIRIFVAAAAVVLVWAAANWMYQVIRKPTELFFPVSGALAKRPHETWRRYGPLFVQHSTAVITPELLAALAQVEGAGNPVARTYWRWNATWNPMEVYRPASSAVGMYQITDATFEDAKRYCIHDHVVVEAGRWSDLRSCWFNGVYTRVVPTHAVEMTAALLDRRVASILAARRIERATLGQKQDLAAVVQDGPWYAWRSCWFNWLYFRVVPSHAVELTSAYLDRAVAGAIARYGISSATPAQKENLAALIHLCGAGVGDRYAKRGLHFAPGLRCGDHDAARYVARVNVMKRLFMALSARS